MGYHLTCCKVYSGKCPPIFHTSKPCVDAYSIYGMEVSSLRTACPRIHVR